MILERLPDTSFHDPRVIPGETVIALMLKDRRPAMEVFLASLRLDVDKQTLEALQNYYHQELLKGIT